MSTKHSDSMLSVVRLWSNQSPSAIDLARRLVERGYPVQHILTGATEPFLQVGYRFVWGYPNINYAFLS
ncbi:MAG: hypothetical protein HY340_03325 [Candidatus Kerfeldbacteria bacterium]|nr:hypothetical protein [Candidatus Kerfeldbacteria bacterium]